MRIEWWLQKIAKKWKDNSFIKNSITIIKPIGKVELNIAESLNETGRERIDGDGYIKLFRDRSPKCSREIAGEGRMFRQEKKCNCICCEICKLLRSRKEWALRNGYRNNLIIENCEWKFKIASIEYRRFVLHSFCSAQNFPLREVINYNIGKIYGNFSDQFQNKFIYYKTLALLRGLYIFQRY